MNETRDEPAGPQNPPPPAQTVARSESRAGAVLCHLAAFSAFVGVPFGNILGPLLVWLLKRGEDPQVDAHGKESLNFQISITIYGFALGLVILGLVLSTIGMAALSDFSGLEEIFPIFPFGFAGLVGCVSLTFLLAEVVLVIIAAIKAGDGELFRYPLTIRLIR